MAKRLVPGVAGDRWAGEDEEDDVKVRPGGPRLGPRGGAGGGAERGAGPGPSRAVP